MELEQGKDVDWMLFVIIVFLVFIYVFVGIGGFVPLSFAFVAAVFLLTIVAVLPIVASTPWSKTKFW